MDYSTSVRKEIHAAAREYARSGIKIFPLKGKEPLPGLSWKIQCSCDIKKIDQWFGPMGGHYNIGMPTGKTNHNLVCIDIDPRKGDVVDKWTEENKTILDFCDTVQISGKMDGGAHYFFKAADKYLKTINKLTGSPIEYLADGRYVVLSPSVHPDTGWQYYDDRGHLQLVDSVQYLPNNIENMIEMHFRGEKLKKPNEDWEPRIITNKVRESLMKRLNKLDGGGGRHQALAAWVTDAVDYGLPDEEIVMYGNGWIRERHREPQMNEVENMIKFAKSELKSGKLEVLDKSHDPSRLVQGFDEVKDTGKKNSLDRDTYSKISQGDWDSWVSKLRKGRIPGTLEQGKWNYTYIVENMKTLRGRIKFNELSHRIEKFGDMPWEVGVKPDEIRNWTDLDTDQLSQHIDDLFQVTVSKDNQYSALAVVSSRNSYHPLQDYLLGLEWDGERRLNDWLIKVTHCEDTGYHRRVGEIMLLSIVARALRPGIKVDHVPVLESSRQGLGKTTLCQLLAWKDKYYEADPGELGTKMCQEKTQGKWIVELPEFEKYLTNVTSAQAKSYITIQVDRYREAYARIVKDFPRTFMLLGTTNRDDYLRDATGNRRYLPIRCGDRHFDLEYVVDNLDQLYAECVHVLTREDGYRTFYKFDEKLWDDVDKEQRNRIMDDAWQGLFAKYLQDKDRTTIAEVLEKSVLILPSSVTQSQRSRAKSCLSSIGWKEVKGGKSVGRYWIPG